MKGALAVRRERMKKACTRFGRAQRLGAKIATSITRVAIVPSATYGVAIHGINEKQLSNIRGMTARAYGKVSGRSVTARLIAEDNDPAFHAVVQKQVFMWICAVWDELLPQDVMQDAWRLGCKKVGMSFRPHAGVTGGAGAFWSALRRVGWSAPAWNAVKTREGKVLHFGKEAPPAGTQLVDPRSIMKYLRDEYEESALSQSQLALDLEDIGGARGYPRCKAATAVERAAAPGIAYGKMSTRLGWLTFGEEGGT